MRVLRWRKGDDGELRDHHYMSDETAYNLTEKNPGFKPWPEAQPTRLN